MTSYYGEWIGWQTAMKKYIAQKNVSSKRKMICEKNRWPDRLNSSVNWRCSIEGIARMILETIIDEFRATASHVPMNRSGNRTPRREENHLEQYSRVAGLLSRLPFAAIPHSMGTRPRKSWWIGRSGWAVSEIVIRRAERFAILRAADLSEIGGNDKPALALRRQSEQSAICVIKMYAKEDSVCGDFDDYISDELQDLRAEIHPLRVRGQWTMVSWRRTPSDFHLAARGSSSNNRTKEVRKKCEERWVDFYVLTLSHA